MARVSRIVVPLVVLIAGCGCAQAHSFGMTYNLPIPFWMYAFAASATLALSFLMIGFFVTAQSPEHALRKVEFQAVVPRAVWTTLRCLSVLLLVLTILTGLFGTQNPFNNFSLTFFWIGFVLGFAYLTALIGDVYAFINPWRVICDMIARLRPTAFSGRVQYPTWLAYYPALALYMGFIWLELFGHTTPFMVGLILLGYTILNLTAAEIFGAEAWFRYGEFFAVFFRLIAKISPIAYTQCPAPTGWKIMVRLRRPFGGLIEETADHPSILLFVLFMLSSTAFDGLHETLPWAQLFWKYLYPPLAWGITEPYSFFVGLYYDWQWSMLWLSPFIYLAIYLFFVWMITGSGQPLRERALKLGFSLIPIAFVYNLSHYFTLLFTDAPRLVPLISDPFGVGDDLFGTAHLVQQSILPPARFVWHIQVGLILIGHVVSVYLAHAQALRIFPKARQALWSQFPMLVLMIGFTTAGLWILSLPISAGQVLDPIPSTSALPPAQIMGPMQAGTPTSIS